MCVCTCTYTHISVCVFFIYIYIFVYLKPLNDLESLHIHRCTEKRVNTTHIHVSALGLEVKIPFLETMLSPLAYYCLFRLPWTVNSLPTENHDNSFASF